MKAIGFKNFRRFKEFPLLELGNVTILVGGNNAGKSTVVKAIVTVLSFLRDAKFDVWRKRDSILDNNFFFNKNTYAHIGTFKRALYNEADSDIISFSIRLEEFLIDIEVKGNVQDENAVAAKVQRIKLNDEHSNLSFEFDFSFNTAKVIMVNNYELFKGNDDFDRRYKIHKPIIDKELGELSSSEIDKLRPFYSKYPLVEINGYFEVNITDMFEHGITAGPLFIGLMLNISYYWKALYETSNTETKQKCGPIFRILPYLSRLYRRLDFLLRYSPLVEYLYAHSASQIVLYNSLDTNDFLVQTIHNFASLRLSEDSMAWEFIKKWMARFNIGDDFKICTIGGEAHTVNIVSKDRKIMPLADKGMGTIQIMILLLRLAIDINDKQNDGIRNAPITILVEEPEQNLHPRMQSLLMDFFYNVSEEYGIKFVIETHSEYLVRRSQILVAEKKYKDIETLKDECPIKVYYFPSDGIPRNMEYGINGRFQEAFDPGFFDESSTSSLLLSRIERGRI